MRVSTPSKLMLKEMLVAVVHSHINDGHELKVKLKVLLPFLEQKDADKSWYLVMLRHFHKESDIFAANYVPPQKPSKAKAEERVNADVVSLYAAALQGMPRLKGSGAKAAKRVGGVLNAPNSARSRK